MVNVFDAGGVQTCDAQGLLGYFYARSGTFHIIEKVKNSGYYGVYQDGALYLGDIHVLGKVA